MSKKVIGIAVIAGLDLAFIILMQAGWDPTEVSQNIEPPNLYQRSLTQKQSLPELSAPVELEPIHDSEEPAAERIVSPKSRVEKPTSVRTSFHSQKIRQNRKRAHRTANPKPKFTDTVIYVKRAEPFQFQQVSLVDPKAYSPEPVEEIRPEPKKRSFFSKAVPIVKKPYEWLKDLAGKLK